MKRSALVVMLVIGLLVLFPPPSYAWRHVHGGVFIGVGPGYWWGPPYPYWYYPPPYYYGPPSVVIQQPPVYVEQPPAPPPPPAYWYYCPSAQAYYPQVQTCPEAWMKVAPRP
jgi:hypothetical protein